MQAKSNTITEETQRGLKQYGLDNFDCPICGNTGQIWWRDENDRNIIHSKNCECMKRRVAIRKAGNSGMAETMRKYSFANYTTPDDDTKNILNKAKLFISSDTPFFVITGGSGSGKTHICTAICSEFLAQGYSVKYMLWRKDVAALKSFSDEKEGKAELNQIINVPVLYIDDFFKGAVSDADISIAFQIIDERYRKSAKTIISSESSVEHMLKIDIATAGRIIERSKGFNLKAPQRNWRIG